MTELLYAGDEPPHRCDLPGVPDREQPATQTRGSQFVPVINAVAVCKVCGRRYVSREDFEGYGDPVRWVPLHWWHFKARRNLRKVNR